tara:strand:- start:201 stop:782 length:582 start_codon:yes stop_codon:yes gene_type:complete
MDKDKYLQFLDYTIKLSNSKEYNTQAVAKMLGLPHNKPYNIQCRLIISYLKKKAKTNKIINQLLQKSKSEKALCKFLVEILYSLFNPSELPKKAPILISDKKYKELIQKHKTNNLKKDESEILEEALNVKYCFCIKKLYLKNIFMENIVEKKPEYNPYAICMSSIYKNRSIKPPKKASYSCRKKYNWYKKYNI